MGGNYKAPDLRNTTAQGHAAVRSSRMLKAAEGHFQHPVAERIRPLAT